MNTDLLNKVEQVYMKKSVPEIGVGDTIEVILSVPGGKTKGDKKRTQVFKGLVIAIKGSGTRKSITVRKISYGVGVEKIFPIHSPNVVSVKILKKGKVKQSKIFYMRERIGKRAMKVRETDFDMSDIIEGAEEEVKAASETIEEVLEKKEEANVGKNEEKKEEKK